MLNRPSNVLSVFANVKLFDEKSVQLIASLLHKIRYEWKTASYLKCKTNWQDTFTVFHYHDNCKVTTVSSRCGTAGRTVASDTRDLQSKSSHR